MGSRILSRSFDVETDDPEEDTEGNVGADTSLGSAMDVDVSQEEAESAHDDDSEHAEEEEDTEEEEPSGVSMVPLADMLNAQYGSENVRILFIILCNNEDLNPMSGEIVPRKR
jgi:SET domain-containing protein 6